MTELEYYLTASLYAMQEMRGKLGIIAELVPNEVAERSFKFADAMLEEAKKRKIFSDNLKIEK